MVIIRDKNKENILYLPKNLNKNESFYSLVLVDRATNKEYLFDNIEDLFLVKFDYYTFKLNFSEIPSGEYEYCITSNHTIFGNGLIRLNEITRSNPTNYNDNRTYIVYDKQ